MICQNCGAEYEESSLTCPYCQSENRKAALNEKNRKLSAYDKEAAAIKREMENFPKRTARKWTFYLLWGIGALFAAGCLILAGVLIFGQISANSGYEKQKKQLQTLQEYCEAEDYAAMNDYISKHDLYSSAFEKYTQICDIYRQLVYLKDELQYLDEVTVMEGWDEAEKKECMESWLQSAMESVKNVLYYSNSYATDRAILGNEAVLQQFYEQCAAILEEMEYTEEEIEALSMVESKEEAFTFLDKMRSFYTAKIK